MLAHAHLSSRPTIRLNVPGTLAYRAIAVRVVAESCRLVTAPPNESASAPAIDPSYDLRHPFDAEFVSAFAEIFNNIAIHAYQRVGGGDIDIVVTVSDASMTVEIRDQGQPFDIEAVARPDLDSLPEGGMGIHIARALLDEVCYEPGPPNLWRLTKALKR
jgi:serine/threonine-protein kinase RsbW